MLSGTKVLDLSRVLAGPLCTMMLADLGADVIKVERPGTGDETRGWGPPFDPSGHSAYYLSVNRNKKSVAANLDAQADRDLILRLAGEADVVVDTSALSPVTLRRKLADDLLTTAAPSRLAVTFTSFGHKHGPLRDADLMVDVRFLPNPHYEAELRPLTGLDEAVIAHIDRDGELTEFYEHLLPFVDYLLPQYVREGKAHLLVGVGCTGGRHRSVAVAEHLAAYSRGHHDVVVDVVHRDVGKPPR